MKQFLGAVVLAVLAASANASEVDGTYSNQTKTGDFDLGSLTGFRVTGGTATFTFADLSTYSLASTTHSESGGYSTSYYTTQTTYNYTNPLDAAEVRMGGVTASGSNGNNYSQNTSSSSSTSHYQFQSGSTPVYGSYTYSYRCGWSTCYSTNWYISGYAPVYSTGTKVDNTTSNYSGYTGSFTASISLTGNNWIDDNGHASFSFLTTSGATALSSARLDYSVEAIPAPAPAAPVPEPEAFAMMVAGLGLIGFASRRRRLAKSDSVN